MESDKRFAHIVNDPKFRRIPRGERKVKIDKRFQSMFTDKKFKVNYTVDKRGRPINHTTTEDLRRYYDLDSDEEDEDDSSEEPDSSEVPDEDESTDEDQSKDEEEEGAIVEDAKLSKQLSKQKLSKGKQKQVQEKSKSKLSKKTKYINEPDDETNDLSIAKTDGKVPDKVKKKLKNLTVDYARGEGNLLSDNSSSDDEETDEEVETVEEGIDHKWGEMDADAQRTDEITNRLAACNMDWDRIRATDLMVLFNSFLPPVGSIKSVVIYPSEFGKKRLAEEEVKGPAELIKQSNPDEDGGNTEGAKYHMEKLRQYQLNRLKYYYAVVTCDSASSANKIYTECDGMEYESSATKIDLRFIPDDMSFEEDEPKETCSQLPELNKYKPRFFTTTALQQAKVDLTWDETNPQRLEITQKLASGKIDDITESDLQGYLASSSGEESGEENEEDKPDSNDEEIVGKSSKNAIDKYKMLLQEIEAKEKAKEKKDVGMEISWGIDLQKKTEKIIKDKKFCLGSKTPFEQFLDKRKEKRKEKRAAKKSNDDSEEEEGDDAPSDIDMNDPYFAEEFNNLEFKQNKKGRTHKTSKELLGSDYDSAEEGKQKAQLELLLNDEDDGKKHFSLKKIQDEENESKSKKKRKSKKKQPETTPCDFSINVNDERFSALFTSHHYNIDPTDPHYKKTKNMGKIVDEKIKRRIEADNPEGSLPKKIKDDKFNNSNSKNKEEISINNGKSAELNVLVKSIKRKAEAFKNKKK